MENSTPESDAILSPRLQMPPRGMIRSLLWMGPMLMLLGAAIGTGELLVEPAAGARLGGTLFWAILFFVVTKAFWNEAIGQVSIVTGQNFLESCAGAGPLVAWVPWVWYVVNILKDFMLRGGIVAVAGMVCYDTFGPLPFAPVEFFASIRGVPAEEAFDQGQMICWALLNYFLIWSLLAVGGYRLAETLNTILCLLFTASLVACAAAVIPQATGELFRGLSPSIPTQGDDLLILASLAGIVMSGSSTIYYTAWAEERGMGLFYAARHSGRRIGREEIEPQSEEEVRQMRGWLRVNSLTVTITYVLGALICVATFVLGVAVLRPAGVTLKGADLASELSLMMTTVAGPWAKPVFYVGAYAVVMSTAIGILDGASRLYIQPLRRQLPGLFQRVSFGFWQKSIMTLMVIGCWTVYVFVPDALRLVFWMGAADAPLVGILIMAYAYLGKWYLPKAYRRGWVWAVSMILIGTLYLALGVFFFFQILTGP